MATEVKRTADHIMAQEPVIISLGGESFKIKPLVIKNARKFRKQVLELIGKAGEFEQSGNLTEVIQVIQHFFDEDLIYLVGLAIPEFASKDLTWIEENVTEAELQSALGEIFSVNFPWIRQATTLASIGSMMQKK